MEVLEVQKLLFILVRVTAFMVLIPGLSPKSLPATAKLALSFGIALIVYQTLPPVPGYAEPVLFILSALRETLIGLAMGFAGKLIFSAVEMAGQFVDFQAGYSMGALYDPITGATASHYGRFFSWLAIMVFFLLDLHHVLLLALMESFQIAPAGQLGFGAVKLDAVVHLFSLAFRMGFSMAAPLLIVLLLTDLVMGIISRTVPQINVFMLGMPLKTLVAMVMTLMLLSVFMSLAGRNLAQMEGAIRKIAAMFP
ncbi:flagellar biosynthetic protein FliR [Proteiniclasticum sp. BAD-10]|uniref:Flagellar biosynthetic protein FliR n=1 Tax=Proteiniclasticum sediminis TaxID=2804028 RepID=A0A941CNP0_9CLOT|nr:flagellar biosynthetic protein FliR [Proteiniclasticum sediminis]MBR0575947.1 flagellar biosynthetic protein FliR [Proteiniclasticum sediminis]